MLILLNLLFFSCSFDAGKKGDACQIDLSRTYDQVNKNARYKDPKTMMLDGSTKKYELKLRAAE
jgi:hypothetical protein